MILSDAGCEPQVNAFTSDNYDNSSDQITSVISLLKIGIMCFKIGFKIIYTPVSSPMVSCPLRVYLLSSFLYFNGTGTVFPRSTKLYFGVSHTIR